MAKNGPWLIICARMDGIIEIETVVLPLFKWKLYFMAILRTVSIFGIRVMSDHWSQRLVSNRIRKQTRTVLRGFFRIIILEKYFNFLI